MAILEFSILVMRSDFSRSLYSVWSWLVLNSSTHKSLCLISSAFGFDIAATMSSVAFLSFVKAPIFTHVTAAAKPKLFAILATRENTSDALHKSSEHSCAPSAPDARRAW